MAKTNRGSKRFQQIADLAAEQNPGVRFDRKFGTKITEQTDEGCIITGAVYVKFEGTPLQIIRKDKPLPMEDNAFVAPAHTGILRGSEDEVRNVPTGPELVVQD